MLRFTVLARRYSTQQRVKTAARYTGYLGLSAIVGVVSLTGVILVHDAFTYNTRHVHRVPVDPLALNPERGGPKNLPIARVLVGDEEDDDAKLLVTKPKLVIVGGGWGVSIRYTSMFLKLTLDRLWVSFNLSPPGITMLRSFRQTHTLYSRLSFLVRNLLFPITQLTDNYLISCCCRYSISPLPCRTNP